MLAMYDIMICIVLRQNPIVWASRNCHAGMWIFLDCYVGVSNAAYMTFLFVMFHDKGYF